MSYIKVMDELIKLMLKPMGKVFSYEIIKLFQDRWEKNQKYELKCIIQF